ncbi:MAG TPA: Hpt domain-containing protein, partial [Geobacteraceae bacterium]
YLAKPTEARALYQAIRQAIRRHVPRPPGGGERRGPAADPAPSLRDNPALLRKLTETFLEDYEGKLAVLREAVESRAAEEIQKAAHGLLGSLLVFGAHRSAEGARRIEACAGEGRLGEAPALYESLEREIRRLADFLKGLIDRPL